MPDLWKLPPLPYINYPKLPQIFEIFTLLILTFINKNIHITKMKTKMQKYARFVETPPSPLYQLPKTSTNL